MMDVTTNEPKDGSTIDPAEENAREAEMERASARTVEEAAETARNADLDAHFLRAGFEVEKPDPNSRYANASYRRLSKGDQKWVVAYKTDWRAFETHRIFIETWSTWRSGGDGNGKGSKGWAVDGRFDAIVIYSPQAGHLWWIPQHRLEENVPDWTASYGIHEVPNKNWITLGIAVPEDEVGALGKKAKVEKNPSV